LINSIKKWIRIIESSPLKRNEKKQDAESPATRSAGGFGFSAISAKTKATAMP
jgi:hypothetical protein